MSDTQTPTPVPANGPPPDDGPRGIGGWLILPIIGLVITIVWTLVTLAPVLQPENFAGFQAFFEGRIPPEYNALMYTGLLSGADGLIGIGLSVVCLIQIFRMKRSVPLLMTVFYIFAVWSTAVEYYAVAEFPLLRESEGDVATLAVQTYGSIFRAALWISYFWMSKRVKNTFVR